MGGSTQRVRAPFVLVGLMMTALGSVGAWLWAQSAGDTVAVAVTPRTLEPGEPITGEVIDEFRSADVAVGSLSNGMVPFAEVAKLKDHLALSVIPADTILTRAALSERMDDGQDVVRVVTNPPILRPGDRVEVTFRDEAGAGSLGPRGVTPTSTVEREPIIGTVVHVDGEKQGSTKAVDLRVPSGRKDEIAEVDPSRVVLSIVSGGR